MDSPDINAAMDAPRIPVLSTFVNFCRALLYKQNTIPNTMNSDNNDTIHASTVQVASTFPKFSLLPKEIQLKIWFHALPDGQIFYVGEYGMFPRLQPHALYDVGPDSREVFLKHYKRLHTHTAGCSYAKLNKGPIFYSPSRDTIVCEANLSLTCCLRCSGRRLLSPELPCCDERKRFFAQLHHVGVLAYRQQYAVYAGAYRPSAIDHNLMLRDGKMPFYIQLFKDYPMLKSFSFVFGSDAVQEMVKEVPGMRSATANYSKEAILEEFYQEKMEEMRNIVEKWKQLHPEAIVPQIKIVYAAKDVFRDQYPTDITGI